MEDYQLTKVTIEGLARPYILEADSIDKLLINPGRKLLGYKRQKAAIAATVSWLSAMKAEGY
ncbi:MAG TPA: hypothetical protein PKC93_19230, partial [Candidatus Obscuribacter sp.]|nr:hypothetical protein [Candidatus Obscuribacter sp.]